MGLRILRLRRCEISHSHNLLEFDGGGVGGCCSMESIEAMESVFFYRILRKLCLVSKDAKRFIPCQVLYTSNGDIHATLRSPLAYAKLAKLRECWPKPMDTAIGSLQVATLLQFQHFADNHRLAHNDRR